MINIDALREDVIVVVATYVCIKLRMYVTYIHTSGGLKLLTTCLPLHVALRK